MPVVQIKQIAFAFFAPFDESWKGGDSLFWSGDERFIGGDS